jgi:nitrogen regulatory protein PII-like uncharacterized protein
MKSHKFNIFVERNDIVNMVLSASGMKGFMNKSYANISPAIFLSLRRLRNEEI